LKKLVVNADDFGYTCDVNAGIIEAHSNGILTATTLMANGAAFDDAVRRASEHPELDVGVHLVLVGGHSLLTGSPFPRGIHELVHAVMRRKIRAYDELKPQIERVIGAGIRPTHLDTHKHTHLMPAVLDAVARLSEEYGIRWVRRPFDFPLNAGRVPWTIRMLSGSISGLRAYFHSTLGRHGCRVTDHFAGFQLTGRFRTAELVTLIRSLPEGVTEFMCHPGRCTDELRRMPTRLKDSREEELKALLAPEVRQAIGEGGVQLTRYRSL
jgi:predicted glycoside hydrolase/deacetylase ChbG (UPF0249 family)